jgi:hypothetical protein
MELHIAGKNWCIWLSGVSVVLLTTIGVLVRSESWGLPPWQWIILALLGLAVIGLTIQLFSQSREDQDRKQKESNRDDTQKQIALALSQLTQLVPKGSQETQERNKLELQPLDPPVNFDAGKYFNSAYQSGWTAEVEKRIRVAAAQNRQTRSQEDFYAKFIGVGLVAYMHDITWAYIWRSQFLMLAELNRSNGYLSVNLAKSFYDKAVIDYPSYYTNYLFDQWLGFIQSQGLLIRHPSEMLEITVRGRDFLSYSAHTSRTADQRKG